mgnify:CR=1 FL=1|jgi:hypothetical protein
MNSLDLIVDKTENYDLFLKDAENHFNVGFYKLSMEYADAYNDEKEYILTASPTKLSFRFRNNLEELICDISSYLSKNYANQVVGIRCVGEEKKLEQLKIRDVRTVIIR